MPWPPIPFTRPGGFSLRNPYSYVMIGGFLVVAAFKLTYLWRFKRGKGCIHCRQTGYIGRTGIFEVVPMSEKIRRLISGQASSLDIYKLAREEGMRTLREAAVEKVFRGITTVTEMVRVTGR